MDLIKTSKLSLISLCTAGLVLIGCGDDATGSSGSPADEVFAHENYNTQLSEAEITEDLNTMAEELSAIPASAFSGPDAGSLNPMGGLGKTLAQSMECMTFDEPQTTEVYGSDTITMEISFTKNGRTLEFCPGNAGSQDEAMDQLQNTFKGASIVVVSETKNPLYVMNSTQNSTYTQFDFSEEGFNIALSLDLVANTEFVSGFNMDMFSEGTMSMIAGMDGGFPEIGGILTTTLSFLDNTYACQTTLDLSALSSADSDAEVTPALCDLTHANEKVGSLDLSGDSIKIYDLDGNLIESQSVETDTVE